jgi:hypothetical protein
MPYRGSILSSGFTEPLIRYNLFRSKVNSCLQRYEEFDNRVIRGIRIALPNAANSNVLRSC